MGLATAVEYALLSSLGQHGYSGPAQRVSFRAVNIRAGKPRSVEKRPDLNLRPCRNQEIPDEQDGDLGVLNDLMSLEMLGDNKMGIKRGLVTPHTGLVFGPLLLFWVLTRRQCHILSCKDPEERRYSVRADHEKCRFTKGDHGLDLDHKALLH